MGIAEKTIIFIAKQLKERSPETFGSRRGMGRHPIVSPSLDLVLRDAVELAVVQPPNFFGEAAGNGAGERFVHFI